jgi:hypothetical protein
MWELIPEAAKYAEAHHQPWAKIFRVFEKGLKVKNNGALLLKALQQYDSLTKIVAAYLLGISPYPLARKCLLDHAYDLDARVRTAAIWALVHYEPNARLIRKMRSISLYDFSPVVRLVALRTWRSLKGRQMLKNL